MTLQGTSIIGNENGSGNESPIHGINPASGEILQPPYPSATEDEIKRACKLAGDAFDTTSKLSGKDRAAFLRKTADNIEGIVEDLVLRATAETGLPEPRIRMETGRTCGQLRLFAGLVEEGSWVDARIDQANPKRQPIPKPDTRSMLRPVGPIVVFCASNFPLAFSVAGGDTASAFAAGCPVIVKAHHAHPGTAELVGQAVRHAVRECGLPEGTFSLIYGSGRTVGAQLVQHQTIKAVGFTGSRAGGRALFNLASARPEPIPVYAEMSSVNPIFILPEALAERGEEIATGLHGSSIMGVGQFCTNPGIVLTQASESAKNFASSFTEKMSGTGAATMLHSGIRDAYEKGVEAHEGIASVLTLTRHNEEAGPGQCSVGTAVFSTTAEEFLAHPELTNEIFGPASLLVQYTDHGQALDVAKKLEGQLTATIFGTDDELAKNKELIAVLESKAGRLIFNQFPTGVEVCHSMVHGGPYPATTDGRSTSVGTGAILRFSRPVCYQNFPQGSLPDEIKDGNPLGINRTEN
ncbi:MAG: aldehyde dehydrogenase (NADP(+)) [Opitutae bacterium]|jgi:2,5-dioxopentanoate dehydrogenase|nr:aldehyde dehydrogenase (NADP(+)) [Opitutae bacterium]MBT5690091.1 aldehyde dehydrogenase (NADP(+)) [Opitutae bacterium]